MKIGVLLAGCGVYDGSEIQETVSVLIALDELGVETVCMAPAMPQHHVINHTRGEEMSPARDVLTESARIARGDIADLAGVNPADLDGLVIPGGFGVAKNLCSWAFDGPEARVNPEAARVIGAMISAGKPVAALCVAPVLVAKVLQELGQTAEMTLGNPEGDSPYDIAAFHGGIESVGMTPATCALGDIVVDETRKLITSPCYMMNATPVKILEGVRKACTRLVEMA